MTEQGGHYIIVGRRRVQPGEEYRAGDVVDMYRTRGDLHTFTATPDDAGLPPTDPHEHAREQGPLVQAERASLRVLSRTGCTCRKRSKPLAVAYARDGRVWVWVAPQWFPRAVRDEELERRQGVSSAWPGHTEPGGREHLELATCRDCRRHWAVMIREDGYRVLELDAPRFGVALSDGVR